MTSLSPPLAAWTAALLLVLLAARPVVADAAFSTDGAGYQAGALGPAPNQTFHSSPIVAPLFQVSLLDGAGIDATPYIFLATAYNGLAGPMIFRSHDLSLVYADQRWPGAFDARAQTLNGTDYLTFWEGVQSGGHANGYCGVFGQDYSLKYNLTALGFPPGVLADLHEFKFTDDRGALFTIYENIPYNATPVGGPENGILMDSLFQEIDVATNEQRFQWRASDHFAIADSYGEYTGSFGVGETTGFDFFHINAVSKTPEGNYLVSSRHLHVITLINGTTGVPVWILGGKRNQFSDLSGGNATNFGWQHDARFFQNETHVTFFDNHVNTTSANCTTPGLGGCSRGVHLELDIKAMTARLVAEFPHPDKLQSGAMGSYQALPSGNVLTGWGTNPTFAEFLPNGTAVMNVELGVLGSAANTVFVYRAYKLDWVGYPSWPPNIAAIPGPSLNSTNGSTVYLSWNGATELASWAVLADNTTANIDGPAKVVARANRTGFETSLTFHSGAVVRRYVRAAALAANGTILGSTPVVDLLTGQVTVVNGTITQVVVLEAPPTQNATSSAGPSAGPSATSSTAAPSQTKKGGSGRAAACGWTVLAGLFVAAIVTI